MDGVVIEQKDILIWTFQVYLVKEFDLFFFRDGEIISFFSGLYDEELTCWRPRGDSIFNELRRFFIGGSNELQDISYLAIPKQFQNDKVFDHLTHFIPSIILVSI